ncbi:MAG: hypothetical protein ACQET7_00065 [Thermodesulfobacteriota bacterium]
MRAYTINEISRDDLAKITGFLQEHALSSPLEGLFWGRVPDELLDERQAAHPDCRPHVFGIEVGEDWINLEFFIRSLPDMQCPCSGYATRRQLDFIIEFAHSMIQDLGIRT